MKYTKRPFLKNALKLSLILYILITTSIGTEFLIWFAKREFEKINPLPIIPIALPSDYYFSINSKESGLRTHITDQNGKEIIKSDVSKIMLHDKWLYGIREDLAGQTYYFLCKYGQSCAKQQNYNDVEFADLIEKHRLPPFRNYEAKNYFELLRAQAQKKSYP